MASGESKRQDITNTSLKYQSKCRQLQCEVCNLFFFRWPVAKHDLVSHHLRTVHKCRSKIRKEGIRRFDRNRHLYKCGRINGKRTSFLSSYCLNSWFLVPNLNPSYSLRNRNSISLPSIISTVRVSQIILFLLFPSFK